jgi:hypothetical protein
MSLTRIGSIGINTGIAFAGVTTIVTLNTANDALSIGATVNVGSGITLGASGDIFATGVCTATSFSGSGANLTGIDTDLVSDTSPQLGGNLDVNTKNIVFGDSGGATDDRLTFGAGTDLSIYHDGTHSNIVNTNTSGYISIDTDNFRVRDDDGSENIIRGFKDAGVELYFNNSKKLETASGGVTVTGTVAATSYTGDGSALTGIAVGVATTVATGITGITTVLDLSNNDHKITVSGITTVDVRGGTEGDSHSLRIINSGITTVGFSTYFLFPSGGTPNLPTADGALSMISFTVHRQGVVGLATQLFAGASVNFS